MCVTCAYLRTPFVDRPNSNSSIYCFISKQRWSCRRNRTHTKLVQRTVFNSSNSNRVEAFTVLQAITSLVFVSMSEWMRFQGRHVNPSTVEDLGIQVSPFVFSPSSFGDPFSNFGLRQLSQVFSLYFCCGSLYGVPINQGNYLALRFSGLEFTRESERQPIRGCKNYLRKKIWRGQKFVEEISSSLVGILHFTFAWPGSYLAYNEGNIMYYLSIWSIN